MPVLQGGVMRRKLSPVTALLVVVAALAALPSALGGSAVPGLTARTVTIGGTFPLSGPASRYAPNQDEKKSYFSYVNATRVPGGKLGVGGRQIVWKYYDDAYNPAQTVQLTQQL